jgi:hypothetical protein
MGGQCSALTALPPRKRPGTYLTGDWEDTGASLDGYRKPRPHCDSNLDHLTCSTSLYWLRLTSRHSQYIIPGNFLFHWVNASIKLCSMKSTVCTNACNGSSTLYCIQCDALNNSNNCMESSNNLYTATILSLTRCQWCHGFERTSVWLRLLSLQHLVGSSHCNFLHNYIDWIAGVSLP